MEKKLQNSVVSSFYLNLLAVMKEFLLCRYNTEGITTQQY